METDTMGTKAGEPGALTYGMSAELRNSGLLTMIRDLSHEDKKCLIRYLYETDIDNSADMDFPEADTSPYTMEELNARIDEAEAEMERGEGKTFSEMMSDFKKELLWLK